jgi:hypothetical protein
MEQEFTILPFPLLPITSLSGDQQCQEDRWNLLLERISRSNVQKIKQSIGDGIHKRFVFNLPFEIVVSWRVASPVYGVVQPDCLLTADRLTIIFGTAPSADEFEIEIIGISRQVV